MATDDTVGPDSSIAADTIAPQALAANHEIGDACADPAPSAPDPSQNPALPVISKLLKGKEAEWNTITSKDGPLRLLDLPVDVLGIIVSEVATVNDLTSLALTNSTLYNLAIPLIYCDFDIVWPDSSSSSSSTPEPSRGVDALTYGLSTLCLGSRFSQRTRWLRGSPLGRIEPSRRLASNQYANYVRKFSIGNGQESWTSEYAIGEEGGKMLGTLVAIAVSKMVNLETFVWDMPTGVLSDVFMALASLQDHYPDGSHKLAQVWVRWHSSLSDGSDGSVSSGYFPPNTDAIVDFFNGIPQEASTSTSTGNSPGPPPTVPKEPTPPRYAEYKVEYPTFSILPALESLTVLNVDEVAYLDEVSQLLERSRANIRELRIGLSSRGAQSEINHLCDGDKFQQVDLTATWPGESQIGDKRLGGVLGVVFGRIFDLKTRQLLMPPTTAIEGEKNGANHIEQKEMEMDRGSEALDVENDRSKSGSSTAIKHNPFGSTGKLRLRVLELEKLAISVPVCERAIDWSVVATLTILDCAQHETLWRMLRKRYQVDHSQNERCHLALKNVHTDNVSTALMTFLKDTLVPNSLETLFLQARRISGQPAVSIGQIMKGPVRRHRSSLRKLLLDSVYFRMDPLASGLGRSHWALSSSWVSFVTSGQMTNLRELSVAFDARAWHPFLRGFPNITELRSLHALGFPNRANDAVQKERAVQIVDVLSLRPESKLCYFGIGNALVEIMEAHTKKDAPPAIDLSGHVAVNGVIIIDPGTDGDSSISSSSDSDMPAANPIPPPPVVNINTNSTGGDNHDEWSSHNSSAVDSDTDSYRGSESGQGSFRRWLYLHQIPFCDDEVDIFRARHAKLGGGIETSRPVRRR